MNMKVKIIPSISLQKHLKEDKIVKICLKNQISNHLEIKSPKEKRKLGRIFRQPEDILKKKRRLQKTTLERTENSEINLKN